MINDIVNLEDRYDSLIAYYANVEGLLLDGAIAVKAVCKTESNFDPGAVGPTGDLGLTQFTIPTWKDVMGEVDPAKRANPERAIQAAARFLKRVSNGIVKAAEGRRFAGFLDLWKTCYAAYNAGPGYVHLAIRLTKNAVLTWHEISTVMSSEKCVVRGKRPRMDWVNPNVDRFAEAYIRFTPRRQPDRGGRRVH